MSVTVMDNAAAGCFGISSPEAAGVNRVAGNGIFAGAVVDDADEIRAGNNYEQLGDLSNSNISSSIGKNSDDDAAGNSDCEEEVQSKYKKCEADDNESGSFEDAIQALEEALPFRRGISRFYNGKSKSFTSLADTTRSASVKDFAKPENAYTRKRRNLLASTLVWEDKNRIDSVERISKRSCTNMKRTTTFAFAVAMKNSGGRSTVDEDNNPTQQVEQSQLNGSPSCIWSFSALRSFSMADLQRCQ